MKTIKMSCLALALAVSACSVALADSTEAYVEFLNSGQPSARNLPFSKAVRVGRTLYLAGEIGTNKGKLVSGGITQEATQALDNIQQTLNEYDYFMSDVVKCTVMLGDISDWPAFNEVYISYFSKPYPARSAFGANGLALNASVEVECIAAK
ncbi:MAG: reactive intermediate/imine deaminase [Halioglobus sp.]